MITIRGQQIDDIKQKKVENFIEKANQFLRNNYSDKTDPMTNTQLNGIIENAINRAEKYDIITEQGIISFLEFMFSMSLDYDSNPKTGWTKTILNDHFLSEPEKIMSIINTLKTI